MNLVFCGGGTAGHITPAIAIAECFLKRHPSANIYFVGREGGKENELIKKAGFELFTISIEGLSRRSILKNAKVIKKAYQAKNEAKNLLIKLSPNAVIGTGGYVCWPVISAAKKLGIKIAIHESNAEPGLTSKLLLPKCDIFLMGMENKSRKYKNAYFTGNPLREKFKTIRKSDAKRALGIPEGKKLILSVGGSIGAEKINDVCISLMEELSIKDENIYHLHSTGHRYFENLKSRKHDICRGIQGCKAVPFINDMATAISAADVVISRCGAITLSEIAFASVPSILIPSPNVTGNHQLKNALIFKKKDAAYLIEEKNLTSKNLKEKIFLILQNDKIRQNMQKNAKSLSVSNSALKIVRLIENKLLTK